MHIQIHVQRVCEENSNNVLQKASDVFRRHINGDEQLYFHSSCPGGSHYLLLDEISKNLHKHGHEVRMLLQLGNPVLTGDLCKHKHTC